MKIFFILLGLIGIAGTVCFFLFWRRYRNPINRYYQARATSLKKEPSIGKNPLDHDVILGLKSNKDAVITQSTSIKEPESPKSTAQPDVFVALYLMAPENSVYAGYELLQALLSAGLRFGEHRIFHRHANKDGRGHILFHCASAVAPGTFDLSKMGGFTSSGLCLFFSIAQTGDLLATFDVMLNIIDQLVDDLGGRVLDENHESFTKEKMILLRKKIRTVEANKNTLDMFETI